MPPTEVKESADAKGKCDLVGLSSLKDESMIGRNDVIFLELSSLLGITTEILKLSFMVLQSCKLGESVFTSRLRTRFQELKQSQLPLESNEEILHHLGLDSFCEAWIYVTNKCSLADNHLDLVEWAVLYLQDLIRYRLFPENIYGKFPYQESTVTDTWFKHAQELDDESSKTVNVLNMGKKLKKDEPLAYPQLDGTDFPEGMEEEGYDLFYHGTDHKSAISILEDGIDLTKGKRTCDFSHGKGFYLNNKYQEARNWAFRIRNIKQEVQLFFKLPKEVIDNFRQDSINLCEEEDEWNRIVGNFSFTKEMRPRISFIEGPIASVVVHGSLNIKGPIEGSYQLCLHSDDLADAFHLYLHSSVLLA
jgi:hypothetical protein